MDSVLQEFNNLRTKLDSTLRFEISRTDQNDFCAKLTSRQFANAFHECVGVHRNKKEAKKRCATMALDVFQSLERPPQGKQKELVAIPFVRLRLTRCPMTEQWICVPEWRVEADDLSAYAVVAGTQDEALYYSRELVKSIFAQTIGEFLKEA